MEIRIRKGYLLKGLDAEYEILDELGKGGKGVTFLARVVGSPGNQLRRGTDVAIKVPRIGDSSRGESIRTRTLIAESNFKEEEALKVLSKLPCVAQVYYYGDHKIIAPSSKETPLRTFAIVQRYIPGSTLTTHLTTKFASGDLANFRGLPSADLFFDWAVKITKVIRTVHEKGVVHGDVWQNNFIVTKRNDVVLIDFGQAAFRDDSLNRERDLTGSWMAPERRASVEADIYALGALFLYLASGNYDRTSERHPTFPDDNDALKEHVRQRIGSRNPSLLSENWGIVDVIARCLRYNPHHRPPNASVVLGDLGLFGGRYVDAKPFQRANKIWTGLSRNEPLLAQLLEHQYQDLSGKLSDLQNGLFDLNGDHEQIVAGLVKAVSFLEKGDEYLSLTFPAFWEKQNLGVSGRFLSMNRQAVYRGAIIRRLFVVTPEELMESPLVRRVFEAQHEMVLDVESTRKKPSMRGKPVGACDVRYKVMHLAEREDLINQGQNYGLIVNGNKRLLMSLDYKRPYRIYAARFRTASSLVAKTRSAFNALFADSIPISNFFDAGDSSKAATKRT